MLSMIIRGAINSTLGSVRDLMPVVAVVVFFQVVIIRQPLPDHIQGLDLLLGLVCVILGLTLFIEGLKLGLFPMGEQLAQAFAQKGSAFWLLTFAFTLGFGTTVAEPALIAVASKAADNVAIAGLIDASPVAKSTFAWHLRLVVALSVGTAVLLGVLRIIFGWPLHLMIIAGYLMVLALTAVAPSNLVAVAYDSGGVTTSTITVPLVTALGVGLSSTIRGRNPLLDGFGLIALASVMPIIFVLSFSILLF